jgi:hypothetical protein
MSMATYRARPVTRTQAAVDSQRAAATASPLRPSPPPLCLNQAALPRRSRAVRGLSSDSPGPPTGPDRPAAAAQCAPKGMVRSVFRVASLPQEARCGGPPTGWRSKRPSRACCCAEASGGRCCPVESGAHAPRRDGVPSRLLLAVIRVPSAEPRRHGADVPPSGCWPGSAALAGGMSPSTRAVDPAGRVTVSSVRSRSRSSDSASPSGTVASRREPVLAAQAARGRQVRGVRRHVR